MDHVELYRIVEDAMREEELGAKEIPAIDLYMDQILSLVSEKSKAGSERYHDRPLTKTMINNYSKDGLITPVKGKKYNSEQIMQILTIYTLKNSLSIGEIKRLLQGAYGIEGFDGADLTALYDRHLAIKQGNRDDAKEALTHLLEKHQLNVEDERDYLLTICGLLSLSGFLHETARAMLDAKYPLTDDEPEKEKEKEKDKDKDKEKKKKKKSEHNDAE